MDPRYYCDVDGKTRFTARSLQEVAAYLSGCFCFDPLPLWQWANAGEQGVFRCGYGFRSADVGVLEGTC